MAKLVLSDYFYKCSNCNHPIFLPGIVPTAKTIQDNGWKYCPVCGEKFDFVNTESD